MRIPSIKRQRSVWALQWASGNWDRRFTSGARGTTMVMKHGGSDAGGPTEGQIAAAIALKKTDLGSLG